MVDQLELAGHPQLYQLALDLLLPLVQRLQLHKEQPQLIVVISRLEASVVQPEALVQLINADLYL